MKEKTVENKIKEFLDKKGIYYHKNHGSIFSKLGIPDIECCYKGRYLGLEIKRKDKFKISMAQIKNGLKITKNNGIFAFLNDVEQIKEIIFDIDSNKTKIRHNLDETLLKNMLKERMNKLKNEID